MSNADVLALLDRPSSNSMGMLGLIVRDPRGEMRTDGVVGSQAGSVSMAALRDLFASGQATEIAGPSVELANQPSAALWIGRDFGRAAATSEPATPAVSVADFWNNGIGNVLG
jgi:hypothetical protein